MAVKTETTTINDIEYSCTQMAPSEAGPIKFQLIGIFGSALSDIVAVMKDSEEAQLQVVLASVQKVIKDTGPEELFAFIKKLVKKANRKNEDGKYTRIDDKVFEEVFADNMTEIYHVFGFVLRVNFGGFLTDLGLKKVEE